MEEVKQGERLKWGYGYCWRNYDRDTTTTMLVPLNILFRWIRELYLYLYSPARYKKDREIHNKLCDEYNRGFNNGEQQTINEMIKEYKRLLTPSQSE